MEVTKALVRHVARLARLELADAEVATMVRELARILAHVEAIAGVDAGPPADAAAVPPVPSSSLRADEVVPGLDRREALANAPAHDEVFFLVPRVLGED